MKFLTPLPDMFQGQALVRKLLYVSCLIPLAKLRIIFLIMSGVVYRHIEKQLQDCIYQQVSHDRL